jgi:hypothetical protein
MVYKFYSNGFRPVSTLVDITSNTFLSAQRFSERTVEGMPSETSFIVAGCASGNTLILK